MGRYQRLFEKSNFITKDCPIVIDKYVLTKDIQTSNILLQIKFQNVSLKNIIGIEIGITCYDLMNNKVDFIPNYMYQDMVIPPKSSYGGELAILLGNNTSRAVDITCTRVVFDDRSIWENTDGDVFVEAPPVEPLVKGMEPKLSEQLTKYELKRYNVFPDYLHKPLKGEKLSRCVCGQYNFDNTQRCLNCNQSQEFWDDVSDPAYLSKKLDERLEEEERQRQEAEKKRIEEEKRRAQELKEKQERQERMRKRIIKIGVPSLVALVVVFAAILLSVFVIVPNYHYSKAKDYMNERNFEEALKEYKLAGDTAKYSDIDKAEYLKISKIYENRINGSLKNAFNNKNILKYVLFPNVGKQKFAVKVSEEEANNAVNAFRSYEIDENDQDGYHYYNAKNQLYRGVNPNAAWSEIQKVKNKKQFKDYKKTENTIHDALLWKQTGQFLRANNYAKAKETLGKIIVKDDMYKAVKKVLDDDVLGQYKKGSKAKYVYISCDPSSQSAIAVEISSAKQKPESIKDKIRDAKISCVKAPYNIKFEEKWESPKSYGYDDQVCYWEKKGTISIANKKLTEKAKMKKWFFGGKKSKEENINDVYSK